MKYITRTVFLIIVLLSLSLSITAQDSSTCSATMQNVLNTVGEVCAELGRNQACYGNVSMQTTAREGVNLQFEQVGDIVEAADIQSIKLSPMSADGASWGVAVMSLQASIPDSVPGQNVKFVLFGDVELTNAASGDNARPMQAFYLKTGIGQPECAEAPENGMLVQTPQGIGEVTFAVNGVNMALGSTAFLTLNDGNRMSVSTLEGAAVMSYGDNQYPIVSGSQLNVPLGEDLLPSDLPETLEAIADTFEELPFELLDEDIEDLIEPLTDEELNSLIEHFENDGGLCGEDPLPSCEDYPWLEDWEFSGLEWGDEGFGDIDYDELLDDILDEACEDEEDCEFLDDLFDEDCEEGDEDCDILDSLFDDECEEGDEDCEFLDNLFDDECEEGDEDCEFLDDLFDDECEGDDCEFFDDEGFDDEAYDDEYYDDEGFDDEEYTDDGG